MADITKTLILITLTFLFIIPMSVAQQEDVRFYHETGINLTIFEKCRIDGARCDSSFDCFLTVLSPSQELIIDNETMNGPGVYYNFTLNETQTDENGIHEATVDCSNVTEAGSDTFFYENNPEGTVPIDEGQSILILGGILLLIIISLFMGWIGFKLNNGAVGLFLVSFSALILIFSVGMITSIFQLSFATFTTITNNYSTVYVLFIILAAMGGLGLILWLISFALKLWWKSRGMSKEDF